MVRNMEHQVTIKLTYNGLLALQTIRVAQVSMKYL